MIETLRTGGQMPADAIFTILHQARKSAGELVLDVFTARATELHPGDDGPRCHAKAAVYVRSSHRLKTGWTARYLACGDCGARLGKQMLPTAAVRRRRKRNV